MIIKGKILIPINSSSVSLPKCKPNLTKNPCEASTMGLKSSAPVAWSVMVLDTWGIWRKSHISNQWWLQAFSFKYNAPPMMPNTETTNEK